MARAGTRRARAACLAHGMYIRGFACPEAHFFSMPFGDFTIRVAMNHDEPRSERRHDPTTVGSCYVARGPQSHPHTSASAPREAV